MAVTTLVVQVTPRVASTRACRERLVYVAPSDRHGILGIFGVGSSWRPRRKPKLLAQCCGGIGVPIPEVVPADRIPLPVIKDLRGGRFVQRRDLNVAQGPYTQTHVHGTVRYSVATLMAREGITSNKATSVCRLDTSRLAVRVHSAHGSVLAARNT